MHDEVVRANRSTDDDGTVALQLNLVQVSVFATDAHQDMAILHHGASRETVHVRVRDAAGQEDCALLDVEPNAGVPLERLSCDGKHLAQIKRVARVAF